MTYAIGSALQAAVYAQLTGDAALTALVGSDIYDATPPGTPPNTYVTLGPEEVKDASDVCADGAFHEFSVSVVTDQAGFQTAKDIAAAACDALVGHRWPCRAGIWWRCGSCGPKRPGPTTAQPAAWTWCSAPAFKTTDFH